jgi:hypothetical protein
MCSKTDLLMAGESAEELRERTDRYAREMKAGSQLEHDLLQLAAWDFTRLTRCLVADRAAEMRHYNEVDTGYEDQDSARTFVLIDNFAASPAATLMEMLTLVPGIDWVLTQVRMLRGYLDYRTSLHPSQRRLGIMLIGRRCTELFTDELVMDWNLGEISGCNGAGALSAADLKAILAFDRPEDIGESEYERRLSEELDRLVSQEKGQEYLCQILDQYEAMLRTLRAEAIERRAIDRALALREATVSVNRDCMLRLRYQREHERGMQSAIATFVLLQDRRLKYGDGDEDDSGNNQQAAAAAGDAAAGRVAEPAADSAVETAPEEASTGFVSPPEAGSRFIATDPEVPDGSTACKQVALQSEPPQAAQPRPGEAQPGLKPGHGPPATAGKPPSG